MIIDKGWVVSTSLRVALSVELTDVWQVVVIVLVVGDSVC